MLLLVENTNEEIFVKVWRERGKNGIEKRKKGFEARHPVRWPVWPSLSHFASRPTSAIFCTSSRYTFLSFFRSYIRDLHLYLHLASILYVCYSLYASLPVSSSRFSFSSESLYVCSLRFLYLFSTLYIASTYY